MKKAGILLVVVLLAASGALAVITHRSAVDYAGDDYQDEIELGEVPVPAGPLLPDDPGDEKPGPPAIAILLDEGLDDGHRDGEPLLSLLPGEDALDSITPGEDGSLHFRVEERLKLQPGAAPCWPRLFYIMNSTGDMVRFSIESPGEAIDHLYLGVDWPEGPLMVEDGRNSGTEWTLKPGQSLPVGLSFRLPDDLPGDELGEVNLGGRLMIKSRPDPPKN